MKGLKKRSYQAERLNPHCWRVWASGGDLGGSAVLGRVTGSNEFGWRVMPNQAHRQKSRRSWPTA